VYSTVLTKGEEESPAYQFMVRASSHVLQPLTGGASTKPKQVYGSMQKFVSVRTIKGSSSSERDRRREGEAGAEGRTVRSEEDHEERKSDSDTGTSQWSTRQRKKKEDRISARATPAIRPRPVLMAWDREA